MKTIKFFTLGCKVNQYETQSIREQFSRAGFIEPKGTVPKIDICVINTCTVTAKADSESLNFIRRAIRENPGAKIIATGCLVELDKDRIRAIDKDIILVRNKDKQRLTELLGYRHSSRQNSGRISYFAGHTRAFLKIQDGCDNFCSYCKVPLVRGHSRSRPLNEIVSEAKQLVKNGFKEIVLCGICLGAYGRDLKPKKTLVEVIEKLEKIPGLLRIRLSSIEAGDVTDALIEKMAHSRKLCPHLHIPIQSGDNSILKKMNRRYSCQDYLRLIKKIRAKLPEIAITTDVLVGFPGETPKNFRNTVKLIRQILPLRTHIFPYSARAGTKAAGLKPQVPPKVIRERIKHLKTVANNCSVKFKKRFLNKETSVLIEDRSKIQPDFWEGYTPNYIKLLVKSCRNLRNQVVSLKIKNVDCLLPSDSQ